MMGLSLGGVLLYVLKSGCVSGVLLGYYWLFLRNRPFHQYNRVYLLSAALLAVVIPLVPLPGLSFLTGMDGAPVLSRALHGIVPGSWKEETGSGRPIDVMREVVGWKEWVLWVYGLVVVGLAWVFFRQLVYVVRLYRRYPRVSTWGPDLYMTREPETPFSFLRAIFWNEELDVSSSEGRQILRHELVHVRQWHTLDLLLLRSLLIAFWFNPVFYFIYRELRTIHEFEADRHASTDGDRFAYAELLVWQTMDARHPALFHSFFSSSIKRRITMITQFPSVAAGRRARLMALPLFILLLCAFSGRLPHPAARPARVSEKPFTVIIDAGHGGFDDGAVSATGVKEKNINLSLARKVKALAAEYGVQVILTRDGDELAGGMKSRQASLHYRSALAGEKKADLFISLHTDAKSGSDGTGFHIYVSKENAHYMESARLGGVLIDVLKPSYATGDNLMENEGHVWVLRAATVPAVLILCGNIDNERDRAFISDAINQEKIARDILVGIVHYKQ
jgi:N-acetylmuramoyl-L-alanine amidase